MFELMFHVTGIFHLDLDLLFTPKMVAGVLLELVDQHPHNLFVIIQLQCDLDTVNQTEQILVLIVDKDIANRHRILPNHWHTRTPWIPLYVEMIANDPQHTRQPRDPSNAG